MQALQRTLPPSTWHPTRRLSHLWKARRDADSYADRAQAEGLRSRAAYKLTEINERFGRFLRPGAVVVDLGAAPGGFSAVSARRLRLDGQRDAWDRSSLAAAEPARPLRRSIRGEQPRRRHGRLVCVDMLDMEPLPGAYYVRGDMGDGETLDRVRWALGGNEADVVLSDMAPDTSGDPARDHVRIVELAEVAAEFARGVLRNGGVFVCKLFSGADERAFRDALRVDYVRTKAFKPAASKKYSREVYYVATGFVPGHMRVAFGNDPASDAVPPVDDLLDDLDALSRRRKRPSSAA